MVMERNKLVLIALLCLAPLLGFAQTSRNPYTTNQNTGIIHNVVPIDGGGRDSTNWNTLGFTNALIGELGSVATFSTFTGIGSNVLFTGPTTFLGTNTFFAPIIATNSAVEIGDLTITHSAIMPLPWAPYNGTNLLDSLTTNSSPPSSVGQVRMVSSFTSPSLYTTTWTNLPAASIDWSKAIIGGTWTNLVAARIPIFTNSSIIYYLTISTNLP